jgi:hypothetical protein
MITVHDDEANETNLLFTMIRLFQTKKKTLSSVKSTEKKIPTLLFIKGKITL